MESKVTKNTSNRRSLSISLLGNSVAIKPVLQQQILASIALSVKEFVTNNLPDKAEITLETIPVHRLSEDTEVIYRCAIALKLAPLWQLTALDIAHQLADSITTSHQDTPDVETGDWRQQDLKSQKSNSQSSTSTQVCLDFRVEVLSPGWIQFRLSDCGLATWLQQLIQIPALLSDRGHESAIGFQPQGEEGETETEIKNRYAPKLDIADQDQLPERTQNAHSLFGVQYAHARCCSLLRLAHRQGLITLSDPDFQTPGWQFVDPNPIPWLYGTPGMESESMRLWLGHPAERRLIAQVLDGIDRNTAGLVKFNPGDPPKFPLKMGCRGDWPDPSSIGINQISQSNPASASKLANALSDGFEKFYSACRIWGEVKTETPQLAQARLGLLGITQKMLRSLLQDQLGVTAPVEL